MNITIDISVGELLDKLTILELKKEIIEDEKKLVEIEKELEVLMAFENIKLENIFYYNILKWVNHQIWNFTDIIKESKELNCEFAQLSKKIFDYNQYRFRVKNMLNSKSSIREQKSYKNDSINIKVDFKSFYKSLTKINKLSILYDLIILHTDDERLIQYMSKIYTTSNFIINKNRELDTIQNIEEIILYDFEDIDVFEFPHINYISGGLLGDFIHQLSVCNEHFINTGRKANIYITDKNLEGFSLGLNRAYKDLSSCLEKQLYINSFKIHKDEECSINLSTWRSNSGLYNTTWYNIFNSDYNIEWAKNKWLNIEENKYLNIDENKYFKNFIMLNVSVNFRYIDFNYNLLNTLNKKVIFICFSQKHYEEFCLKSNTSFNCHIVNNIEDMCRCILVSYCFIGNLSSPLAMAIAMHKYCLGLIGEGDDSMHMKDLNIPNYYYYQNEHSYTKKVEEM
jgi:hypothetical protein